jgi:phosphotransferase system HPr (HPr) family protein
MVKKTIKYTNDIAFHIRPIGKFTQIVKKSNNQVYVTKNNQKVPGEKAMQLLRLEISKDDSITIEVSGDNELKVLDQLINLLLGVD